jgi:hypothetical protein
MTFVPYRGSWTSRYYTTKTAVDYDVGDALYSDATNVLPMVATGEDCLGICAEDKPSTDTGTQRIKVWVPRGPECTALATVGTGTPTAAYEGLLCDPDNTTPASDIDVSTTTESTYRIEKYHSATLVEVSFSPTKR